MIAVVFHRFGPYHLARLEAAGSRFSLLGIEVVAKDSTYAWNVMPGANGFRRVTLFEAEPDCTNRSALARRLWDLLDRERPAALALPGWRSREALAGLLWALSRGVPAVLMSDSQHHDRTRRGLMERVKARLVRMYSAALVGGPSHACYAASLGMPRERIFAGYDVVDNEHFARGADRAARDPKLRIAMGLPAHYFLASCRFEPVKNIPRLLEAYARYRSAAADPWSLVLAGDGRMGTQVRAEIARLGLEESVHLPGFRQYDELPAYYGLASCFVHASTSETWGLVVNEAMACGLPVLVSSRCGCAPELVEEGGNGFTFDPYNVKELARLMLRVSRMPEAERQAMGRRSREIIRRWGPERFAEGLAQAVETAQRVGPAKASLLDRALLAALVRLR